MRRTELRMFWVMKRSTKWRRNGTGFIVAWDEDVVDEFVDTFPEAEKSLKVYTLGPNSCPMLNAAANRARSLGYFSRGSVGNQDARSFNQRTWTRCWTLTELGRRALAAQLNEI